jgi:hypothetical protein
MDNANLIQLSSFIKDHIFKLRVIIQLLFVEPGKTIRFCFQYNVQKPVKKSLFSDVVDISFKDDVTVILLLGVPFTQQHQGFASAFN